MIFLMSRDPFPICSSTFGDYLNFWGSATQKFSPSFHIKNHMPKKKKLSFQAKTCQQKSHSIPTKSSHDQKSCTEKKSMSQKTKTKKSMPHENFTTIKIFPITMHNYQNFPIRKLLHVHAQQQNSHMSKIITTKFFP